MGEPIALASLEQRLAKLESRIYAGAQIDKEHKCMDDLLNVHNRLQSAVTGREKITSVFSKLDDLERFLSPSFKDNVQLTEASKLNLILLEEDHIRNVVDQLQTVKDLQQYLDSEHIRAAPSMYSKFSTLSQAHVDLEAHVSNVTQETKNMIAAYDEIIMTLSKEFILWDAILTKIEESQCKKDIHLA